MIKVVSYEQFPEDNYTKELVYIEIEGKYRVAYVANLGKNGNIYWDPVKIGIMCDGKRKYFSSMIFDSSFLEKDIKALLDSRPWEKNPQQKSSPIDYPAYNSSPAQAEQTSFLDGRPF